MQEIDNQIDLKNPLEKLPKKKAFLIKQELLNVPQQVEVQVKDIETYIKSQIEEWDIDPKIKIKDMKFEFPLPDTIFEESDQNKPLIEFKEQNFDVEKLQVRDLTKEQLNNIYEWGTFNVPSIKFDIPYQWKITHWIILGHKNIRNALYYHLAHCNGHFLRIFSRFYSGTKFKCDIYKGLKAATYKPLKNLIALLFGKKYITQPYLEEKIESQRQKEFIAVYRYMPELRPLQEFYVYKKSLENQLAIDDATKVDGQKILKKIEKEINEESNAHNQKYFQPLSKKAREDLLVKKITQNKDISKEVQQDIFNIMRALKIVSDHEQKYNEILRFCPKDGARNNRNGKKVHKSRRTKGPQFGDCLKRQHTLDTEYKRYKRASNKDMKQEYKDALEKREKIEKDIRTNYPILAKHPGYRMKLQQEAFEKEYDLELQKKNSNILKQLKEEGLNLQHDMFKKQLEFLAKKDDIEDRFYDKHNDPLYTHHIYRIYASPDKVLKQKDYNGKVYYIFENRIPYEVESNKSLWRLKLSFLEFRIFTINVADHMSKIAITFLKKLVYFNSFYTQLKVDRDTGVATNEEYSKVDPFLKQFANNWKSIMEDRTAYENSPDDQFLKKRYGRIYNLISNYLFKFLFYGVLFLLILLPIVQFILAVLFLALTILSPVIILVFLVLQKVFTLVIYDFYNYKNADYLSWFPVISLGVQSGIGIIQATFSAIMVFYDIFRILLHIVLAIVRFVTLHVYGFFTYNIIIKCLGRVPVSESSACYRIAGPGVGKTNFFYSLSSDDLALLVRSKMEEIQLQNYRKYVLKEVQNPRVSAQEMLEKVLQQPYDFFNQNWTNFNVHVQKENLLMQKLDEQINQRKKCFPKVASLQKIRFKEGEIEEKLKQSEEIVNLFIDKETSPQKLRQITQNIWKKIFNNNDIVKPLDMNAWQFEFDQEVTNKSSYSKAVKRNLKQGVSKGKVVGFASSSMGMELNDFEDDYYDYDNKNNLSMSSLSGKKIDRADGALYANTGEEKVTIRGLKYVEFNIILNQVATSLQLNSTQNIIFFIIKGRLDQIIKKEEEEKKKKQKKELAGSAASQNSVRSDNSENNQIIQQQQHNNDLSLSD